MENKRNVQELSDYFNVPIELIEKLTKYRQKDNSYYINKYEELRKEYCYTYKELHDISTTIIDINIRKKIVFFIKNGEVVRVIKSESIRDSFLGLANIRGNVSLVMIDSFENVVLYMCKFIYLNNKNKFKYFEEMFKLL